MTKFRSNIQKTHLAHRSNKALEIKTIGIMVFNFWTKFGAVCIHANIGIQLASLNFRAVYDNIKKISIIYSPDFSATPPPPNTRTPQIFKFCLGLGGGTKVFYSSQPDYRRFNTIYKPGSHSQPCLCPPRLPFLLQIRYLSHLCITIYHTGQCKRSGGCYNELVVAFFSTGGGVKGKKIYTC